VRSVTLSDVFKEVETVQTSGKIITNAPTLRIK
jgi:hypothetical protein